MLKPKLHSLGIIAIFCMSLAIISIVQLSNNLKISIDRCIDLNRFSVPIYSCLQVFSFEIILAVVLIFTFCVALTIFLKSDIL